MRRIQFRHLKDGQVTEAEVVAASLEEWDKSRFSDDTEYAIARYRVKGKDHVLSLKLIGFATKSLSPKPIAIENDHLDSRGRKFVVTTHIIPSELWPSLWPGYPKPWAVKTDPSSGAYVCTFMEGPIDQPKAEGDKPRMQRRRKEK